MNLELYYIYYIETNTICILLLSFILIAYIREMRGAAEGRYYKGEIIEIIIYCVLDMITAIFKGKSFPGAELILQLSNTLYIAFPGIMVLTWGQYIFVHMKKYGFQKSIVDHIFRGLLMISVVITLTSPFTHFAFYLDESNFYHRNPGAYVVPVIAYLYMIFDTGKLLILDRKIDSLKGRRSARNLSIFVIPCIIFSLIQIGFYGCTTAQVGFTMGFMIVYLVSQQNKISKDALTGLNNRREFENQLDNLPKSVGKILITMIDVDSFKSINDTYGHMEGDQAIKTVALILSRACAQCKNEGDFFLARYEGDEFVILSKEFNKGADQALFYAIQAELNIVNETEEYPYDLHLSIGTSFGAIAGKKDAEEILKKADAEMYRAKKKKR